MAVFTKLEKNEIEEFLISYDIGKLEEFNEIVEGIENTNYKLICDGNPYILTIFEKRVDEKDLPFFMDLKLYLNRKNFKCPKPIINKSNSIINNLKDKKAVIVSFINGTKIELPNSKDCLEIGKTVGELHKISLGFNEKKENTLNLLVLKNIFYKCLNSNYIEFKELLSEINNEINFIESSWPENLPSGIIHADLFKDNVFFENGKISGIIDFYFSCYHFFLYDLAIITNDWCFKDNGKEFLNKNFDSVIAGYSLSRKLNNYEINAFNIILRMATIRILITRLHDYIFHPNDAIVVKKDPFEYYNILKWHQKNKINSII